MNWTVHAVGFPVGDVRRSLRLTIWFHERVVPERRGLSVQGNDYKSEKHNSGSRVDKPL